ncbi:hypothetical protein, conserved [Plasmodium gonderi]|uniref:RAP domain-containing protein n=1 Tax=Plasmodium gonderi TaxID=77519 RepID=A0A1Y1JME2_PLAGO|nr:hypothetical protein, conserved [Plasmodium gonderi]GAW83641.1 hypothetical protein, conserved [Plasmodium gonderi]
MKNFPNMLQRRSYQLRLQNKCKEWRNDGAVYKIRSRPLKEEENENHGINQRYRKITVIPFDSNEGMGEYKNMPICAEELNNKNKKEILKIYKFVRNKNEMKKLPSDFLDNLFSCTKKFVRSFLPYEFVSIYKTLMILKRNDKELNLLLHQQIKRIHYNFDVTSISKLFQIFTFSKSKPVYLIKLLTEAFLRNMNNSVQPWNIRELISIFCFFKIDSEKHLKSIFHKCTPLIAKNILKFTPKDVCIIFYSCVKLRKHDPILSNAVAKHVIFKSDSFHFYQLAIILNSFAKMGEKNNKLCKVICEQIKKRMRQPSMPNVSAELDKSTAPSDGVVEIDPDATLPRNFSNVDVRSKEECDEYSLNEKNGVKNTFVAFEGKINTNQVPQPKDISIILNALVKLEYYDNETFNCLIPFIVNNTPRFSPQSLSNLVHAFSQMQINNKLMMDKLVNESIFKMKKFKNIEMSNLASSLIRINRKDKILFTYMIDEFLYRATIGTKFKNYHFDIRSIQQLAYSFSKVGLKDEKVYTILYRLLIRKINEINKMEKKGIVATVSQQDQQDKGEQMNSKHKHHSNGECSVQNGSIITDLPCVLKGETSEPQFDFFCLSTFINSYGKTKMKQKQFFHFISYMIRKKKKKNELLTNQSLCCLLYGLVKLQVEDKKIYQLLLKEVIEKIDTMKPFQVIIILYSFSKIRMYSRIFVKKSVQLISRNIHHLSLADLSLACYALSNLLYRDMIFLYKIYKIMLLNNYEFEKNNVCQLFNAFTKLCFFHKPFYNYIFPKIVVFMHDFDEKELTNLVFSFVYYFHMTKMYFCEEEKKRNKIKTGITSGASKSGDSSRSGDAGITSGTNISRKVEEGTEEKEEGTEAEWTPRVGENGTSPILDLGEEIVKVLKKSEEEKNYLPGEGENEEKICTGQKISSVILKRKKSGTNIISNDIRNISVVEIMPEIFFKNELNIFFNLIYLLNEKYRQKISLISIYQLQIVDLYLKAFFPTYFEFPVYLKTFFFKIRNVKLKIDDYIILSSRTHRNVSRFLSLVGIAHRSEVQFGPYQLDIVVDFLQNKKKMYEFYSYGEIKNTKEESNMNIIYKTKRLEQEDVIAPRNESEEQRKLNILQKTINKNILIEVDGLSHFYKESHSRTMNSIIKNFILKKFGWYIIHVPFQEWNQCFDFKRKLLYAIQILRHILRINKDHISVKDFIHLMKNSEKEKYKSFSHNFEKVSMNQVVVDNGMLYQTDTISGGARENAEMDCHSSNNGGEMRSRTDHLALQDEQCEPNFYTISEEKLFINQTKNKSSYQKKLMKKMRQDEKLKYDFNLSCRVRNYSIETQKE